MTIKTATADVKYVFINMGRCLHLLYKKLAVTNLPSSRLPAINITGIINPENKSPIPLTEKYAAHPAISKDVAPTSNVNFFI